jgi:hypothetical protein
VMGTLFNAKAAVATAKVKHTERKEVKAEQHFRTSPFGQGLIEQNKHLRSVVRRLSGLEKRMDDTESWQTEAQPRIEKAGKVLTPFVARAMMGLDHHEECPCGKRQTWTGNRRCFHCREFFDTPAAMEAHTAEAHHS